MDLKLLALIAGGFLLFVGFVVVIAIVIFASGNGAGNPVATLELNETQGHAPFNPNFTYRCYDPNDKLQRCELKIDNQVFATAVDQKHLFPANYVYPTFYYEAMNAPGNHSMEITAINANGLKASTKVSFTVLNALEITAPGWHKCNNQSASPCDVFQKSYCDKFDATDLSIRQAASEAISSHAGEFSINQLLDIYDWVHSNVFYQNVPITNWAPYYPNETLRTKSGDCKNQAVLIASMVEAIGGTARVLFIPECKHAFAEVYLGNSSSVDELNAAVWAHYSMTVEQYNNITWHTSNNGSENWFIFDTAGGRFPGQTIPECFNASQTFELRDCGNMERVKAPAVSGTAYGPVEKQDETQVIEPQWSRNYPIAPWISTVSDYKRCSYNISIESISVKPMDWYVTDSQGYEDRNAHRSFKYFYGEEQVQKSSYNFNWDKPDNFYIIVVNSDRSSSITVKTHITETCYKQ
ncbi:MAG: transglutaminase-like domain-containing protein [Candidatus Micrarchaeota archaeon]